MFAGCIRVKFVIMYRHTVAFASCSAASGLQIVSGILFLSVEEGVKRACCNVARRPGDFYAGMLNGSQ
jgi:hypothetical protein